MARSALQTTFGASRLTSLAARQKTEAHGGLPRGRALRARLGRRRAGAHRQRQVVNSVRIQGGVATNRTAPCRLVCAAALARIMWVTISPLWAALLDSRSVQVRLISLW